MLTYAELVEALISAPNCSARNQLLGRGRGDECCGGKTVFTSSGSFTTSDHTSTIWVSGCAAGGGGGGATGDVLGDAGGGGGGGQWCDTYPLVVTPSTTYIVTVPATGGAGGSAGSYTGECENDGQTGDNLTFGALLTLVGGEGGECADGDVGEGGAGGTGGTSGVFNGGGGGTGILIAADKPIGGTGGGGYSAVTLFNPVDVNYAAGQAGLPGSGGGGAGGVNGLAETGGNGGPGFLIVEW